METTASLTEAAPTRSLRANFSWTLVGTVVFAGAQWFVSVGLARLGAPEDLGRYALGVAVAAPVFLLLSLNLRILQATEPVGRTQFRSYLGLRALTTGLGLAVCGGVAVIAFPGAAGWAVAAVAVAKAVESFSDLSYGLFLQREDMRLVAVSQSMRGIGGVGALLVVFALTDSVAWAAGAMAVVYLGVAALWDGTHVRGLTRNDVSASVVGTGPRLKTLAWEALPLGALTALDSLNVHVPRYYLQGSFGESAVGFYSALIVLIMTGGIVVSALGNTLMPRMARDYASDRPQFTRLVFGMTGVGVVLSVIVSALSFAFGREILSLIYGAEYGAYAREFGVLMVIAGAWYIVSFWSYALFSTRRFAEQLPMYVVMFAASVVGGWFLVPEYGVMGAVLSYGVGISIRAIWTLVLLTSSIRS